MHDSSSPEQTEIERIVREKLESEFNLKFNFKCIEIYGTKFQIDFYNETEFIYGEIYAGIGKLKSGQIKKVATDILKLATIDKLFNENVKEINRPIIKYLVFIDEAIEKKFKSQGWYAKSIELFNIKIKRLTLSSDELDLIIKAKARQGGNVKQLASNLH